MRLSVLSEMTLACPQCRGIYTTKTGRSTYHCPKCDVHFQPYAQEKPEPVMTPRPPYIALAARFSQRARIPHWKPPRGINAPMTGGT